MAGLDSRVCHGGGGDQIRRSGQSGGDHNFGGTVDSPLAHSACA